MPAAIAGHYLRSLGHMMVVATLLGAMFTTGGLALSYGPDLPAGPTIILIAGVCYALSATVSRYLVRRRARRSLSADST